MGLEGSLFSLPINFKHEIIIPSVVGKNSGHAFGYSDSFPVYMILLSDFIDVVWNEYVVALPIHLIDPDL